MKLNWAERWVVNNPYRVFEQTFQVRWMKKAMPLRPESVALEVGCGRGAGAALVLKEFQPAVLHAMDLDIEMIRKAHRYLSSADRRKVTLYTADVEHLPYRDETLDAVFGFGVLHHVPNWQSALNEISRVLKTGGVYFLEELYPAVYQNFITKHLLLHPSENRFFSRDLWLEIEQAGFAAKSVREVKPMGILGVFAKERSGLAGDGSGKSVEAENFRG